MGIFISSDRILACIMAIVLSFSCQIVALQSFRDLATPIKPLFNAWIRESWKLGQRMKDQGRMKSQASHLGHVGSRCLAKSARTHKTTIAVDAWCRRTSLNYTWPFWCSHSNGNVATMWTPAIPSRWAHSIGTAASMGNDASATPSRWSLPHIALVGLLLLQPLDFVLDRQFQP